jgi:taurine---2-oxoglutarate transaminase
MPLTPYYLIDASSGVTSAHTPLGVVAIKPEIAASFNERPFFGGLTYMGHPLCLAAGVATLKVLEEEKLVERSKQMGIVLRKHLDAMKAKHPSVGDVRSVGLFSGALLLVLPLLLLLLLLQSLLLVHCVMCMCCVVLCCAVYRS